MKFENEPKDPDKLDIDFRRVPEVWSYPIPDQAEDGPDKPRDPIFSVYVSQPITGEDRQMFGASMVTTHSKTAYEGTMNKLATGNDMN